MEINLLDEGAHVRQVRDSIETIVNETSPNYIIQTLLEDLSGDLTTQTADLWHRRIISASKETIISPKYQSAEIYSEMVTSPTIRRMSESIHIIEQAPNMFLPDRPHTISASDASSKRAQISAQTFIPPPSERGYEAVLQKNSFIPISLKPPLSTKQQGFETFDLLSCI